MNQPKTIINEVPDAQAFLDSTAQLREADPIGTNLMGSIAVASMANKTPMRFWVLSIPVTSFALASTRGICLSPSMTSDEATALGHVIAQSIDTPESQVTGPRNAVDALCAVLCTTFPNATATLKHALVVYALDELRLPAHVPGRLRQADCGLDDELLTKWIHDFMVAVGEPVGDIATLVARNVQRGGLYLWEVDGVAVGHASFAAPVNMRGGDVIYKIGLVYTPPHERRKGYASAVTAALCQVLLDHHSANESKCHIMLNADAANPASNKAYQNIGFIQQGDSCSFALHFGR
ncbi:Aste57867_22909 [Aphanomyces stellatus]|uniref:Aste57867_22909 protein n=1 Tax=Aphanomyces stellatus TaxID=120398 RepID=A0A485LL87_9STRA|nr:hypothetical protein As57867_022838 [Aphanomyces stellatus]VFT99559.1 Aste57867_22909 [Aphanomyces stellatus]